MTFIGSGTISLGSRFNSFQGIAVTFRVVEFFYRQPDSSLVELVHRNGALVSWQVGSNDEAVAAAKAGCDLIVAQGIEAGGHIRGRSDCCLCSSKF